MWTVIKGKRDNDGETKFARYDSDDLEEVMESVAELLREGCAVCVLP